jgi:hypothetical protein
MANLGLASPLSVVLEPPNQLSQRSVRDAMDLTFFV